MRKSPFDFGRRVKKACRMSEGKGYYWWWFVLNRMNMEMAERIARWGDGLEP